MVEAGMEGPAAAGRAQAVREACVGRTETVRAVRDRADGRPYADRAQTVRGPSTDRAFARDIFSA